MLVSYLSVCCVLIIDLRTFLSQASSKSSCCVFSNYWCNFRCFLSTSDTFIFDCSLKFCFLLIDVLINIAYLQDAWSFDSAIRSLFLLSSRVNLVVFSWLWWCDCLGNLILYLEICVSDDDVNGVFLSSVRRFLRLFSRPNNKIKNVENTSCWGRSFPYKVDTFSICQRSI